jgi:uncharacterized protein YbaR (Trm112 family)
MVISTGPKRGTEAAFLTIASMRAHRCARILVQSTFSRKTMQKSLLNDDALRLLACPACHAGLALLDPETLLCTGCAQRYPIRDGLPVLIAPALPR